MPTLDEIFADIPKEGDDPFKDMETVTPSESQPENEPKVEEPVVGDDNTPSAEAEENVPFHKHPRWQQMQEKASKVDTLEAELAELRESVTRRSDSSDIEVPESFKRLYGDDPEAYKAYREEQVRLKEELKQELIREQIEEVQREEAERTHWLGWIDEQHERLKSLGRSYDRNELDKIMLDYAPTDADGNLDYDKGYALYETIKASKPQSTNSTARKQLAAAATATTTGDPPKKDFMTPADLRKSWAAL